MHRPNEYDHKTTLSNSQTLNKGNVEYMTSLEDVKEQKLVFNLPE